MGVVIMKRTDNGTGLVFFPAFDWAISATHPEREERLLYTRDQIFEEGIMDLPNIKEYKAGMASDRDVERVHICIPDVAAVATESHLISAGGAITAADAVLTGEVKNAFALVRPPGHHAMKIVHGSRGFCNINNESIMVEHIRRKYGNHLKIAFVDTDAHHADGTQDIYYNDPQVLHISIHQDGRTLYPGTGFINDLGGPGAFAKTLNVPLPPNTTDEGLHYVLDNFIMPVLDEFKPDLIINAAGQDNHYTDPLTNMKISAQGYAELNRKLGPDIAVLQGGYSIEGALPYVNVGIILAMAGLDYSHVKEPDYYPGLRNQSDRVTEGIKHTVGQLQAIWNNRKTIDLNEVFGKSKFYERRRGIYYDTDGIQEEQKEQIYRCSECSGYRTIASKAVLRTGRKQSSYIVLIPHRACSGCQETGLELFNKMKKSKEYDFVYLQDSENDLYLCER